MRYIRSNAHKYSCSCVLLVLDNDSHWDAWGYHTQIQQYGVLQGASVFKLCCQLKN